MIKDKFSISLITECNDNIVMYGLETRSKGIPYSFPSLTSNRERIEAFIGILNRNDFDIDILPELVDDFLEDLYGE
ncbi:MAG: hypothetical protein IKT35_03355 [Clostridia bacterium]|nr:hypothetical protein [Clostridia bacterium]